MSLMGSIPWNTIFATTIYNIWKMRNDMQFDGKELNKNQVVIKSVNVARCIVDAFNKGNLVVT